MRVICKYCKSSDVYIVAPGDQIQNMKLARHADGRMKVDTTVRMHCKNCGYEWNEVLRSKKTAVNVIGDQNAELE